MRFIQFFTLLFVLVLVPITAGGSYFAYQQGQTRVQELNEITPLHRTDIQKAVRLALNLDDVEDLPENEAPSLDLSGVNDLAPTPVPTEVAVIGEATDQPQDEQPIQAETDETPIPAEVADNEPDLPEIDPRRVTVLLMGIDQRQGEAGPFRTDTMIVLSLDPVAKTGAMLSIPRDLWVTVPGTTGTQGRINTANFVGDSPDLQYPGGGPALAMLTVERLIGVPIDHYILVNFDAFITAINVLGNIEICPEERIDDPKYPDGSYGFMPVVIEAGCQAMDAELLLKYARTRATSGGDFDRSHRQQEVMLAVRDQVLSTGGATALLGDAVTIWESLSVNISTDMTLDEIIELGLIASDVNDIRTGTIGTGEVLEGTADDGSQILIPIQTDIFALVADLFRPPNRPAAAVAEDAIEIDPDNVPLAVREEGAILGLLNGTLVTGRARNLEQFVESYNLDVGFLDNAATQEQVNTLIIYYGDHLDTAEYLAAILATINGNRPPSIQRGDGNSEQGNVVVIIGTDLIVPQVLELD